MNDPTRIKSHPLGVLETFAEHAESDAELKSKPTVVMNQGSRNSSSSIRFENNTDLRFEDLSEERLLKSVTLAPIGERLAPYLGGLYLCSKLGQGGMGAVYLGYHPRLNRAVAVKIMPIQVADDEVMIRRFIREAQLAARIQSPHLIGVLDVNEDQQLLFIVMEYVEGISAGSLIGGKDKEKVALPKVSEALEICIAATTGLAAAHDETIVHRDIKPDNILLPYERGKTKVLYEKAKLSDLGLAREERHANLTGAHAGMGTPGFMAPEQAMDASSVGKTADVFGMGATLYALLCGCGPFGDGTVMKLIMRTMNEPHDPLRRYRPEICPALEAIVEKCLSKEPEARFEDAGKLLEILKIYRFEMVQKNFDPHKFVEKYALPVPNAKTSTNLTRIDNQENDAPSKPPSTVFTSAGRLLNLVSTTAIKGVKRWRISSLLGKSRKALDQKNYEEAKGYCKEALSEAPEEKEAQDLLRQIESAQRQSRYAEAVNKGKKAQDAQKWQDAREAFIVASQIPVEHNDGKPLLERLKLHEDTFKYEQIHNQIDRHLQGKALDRTGHYALDDDRTLRALFEMSDLALTLRPDCPEMFGLQRKLPSPTQLPVELPGGLKLELIKVPAGFFYMGNPDGSGSERPVRQVCLNGNYYLSKTPITVEQMSVFVKSSGYRSTAWERGRGETLNGGIWADASGIRWDQPGFIQGVDHPAVAVSWHDAQAFTKWAQDQARIDWQFRAHKPVFRLPSEALWEYAARGPQSYKYPWGNGWETARCNHADTNLRRQGIKSFTSSEDDGYAFTSPVQAFSRYPSWCGALDMCGNVWEWCADWYDANYYTVGPQEDPPGPHKGAFKALRGGSFLDAPLKCYAAARRHALPEHISANIGFRLALQLDDLER